MFKIKFLFLFLLLAAFSNAQQVLVDKVIGVVGKYPVLLSDLQNTMLEQDKREEPLNKCKAMELLLFQ
ncbi:MAG: hypothetical protein H0W61_11115, partial [Bacteroidetes bacterium]|nr:hypothetical protein [Bacteroidota bacterium]